MPRKVLFINRRAPHGSSYASEQLQMAMVFGAFEQDVSLLFVEQGIYCLMKNQQADQIGFQDFSKVYKSLEKYYDIKDIYVDKQSLVARQINSNDLIVPVKLVDDGEIDRLIHHQDVILAV